MVGRLIIKIQNVIVDALGRLAVTITRCSRALVKLVRKTQDLVRAGL